MRDWARSRPGLKPWLRTRSSSSLRPKVEEAAPRSDLIDSPALYCKPVTDLVSSQPLLAFRAQIQARIASLSEEAQVRPRMRTWTAPMGDEIEGDLVRVRLQMPAMATRQRSERPLHRAHATWSRQHDTGQLGGGPQQRWTGESRELQTKGRTPCKP